jgi:hypothetical protein
MCAFSAPVNMTLTARLTGCGVHRFRERLTPADVAEILAKEITIELAMMSPCGGRRAVRRRSSDRGRGGARKSKRLSSRLAVPGKALAEALTHQIPPPVYLYLLYCSTQ